MELDAFMLKPQNDLEAIEIFDGLLNAKSRTPAAYINPKTPYPGENAGLVTMTNADYISGDIVYYGDDFYILFHFPLRNS